MARSFVLSSLSLLILSSSVLSSPIVSTSAVVIPSCPDANGYKYEISGRTYVVQCSTTYSGANLVGAAHLSTTFQECVDACAGKVGCKAVSYIGKTKQCYLKSKVGTSKQSAGTTGAALQASSPAIPSPANLAALSSSITPVASVVAVSNPAAVLPVHPAVAVLAAPPSCPASNNNNYTTANGIYNIMCLTDHLGSDIRNTGGVVASFQACLDQCSANPTCKALSYLPKSGKCYLKSAIGTARAQDTVWGAVFVGMPIIQSSTSTSSTSSSTLVSRSSSSILSSTSSQASSLSSTSSSLNFIQSTGSSTSTLSSYSLSSSSSSSAGLSSSPTQSSSSSTITSSSSTSSPGSSTATSSSYSSSSPFSTIPSTQTSSSVLPSSAMQSSAAASSQSTASGVESTFTGPTVLPAAPPAILGPIAPFDTDMASMDVITPAVSAGLFYGGSSNATNSTGNSTAGTVAKLSLTFQYTSVVLDHSIFITASCSGGILTAVFNTTQSFTQAQSTWPVGTSFLLITADPSCGDGSQNSFFLATSVTFSAGTKTATAVGSIVDLADIFEDMGLDFGTIPTNGTSASNSTASPYVCGSPGNVTIDGLPTAPCGTGFDQALDNELGYYSGADADIQTVVAELAPGVATSTVATRSIFSVVKSVAKAVVAPAAKAVAATVAKVVAPIAAVIPASVKSAVVSVVKAAATVAVAEVSVIASALTGSFSQTMTIPIALTIPASMLSASPWGQQFKFYSFALSSSDPTYAAAGATLASLGSSLTGVTNPSPGVELFCVNCGVTGSMSGTGSLGISATKGFYQGSVSLSGNIQAGLNIGANGFASYSATKDISIISAGLPGFSIPKIVTIGPSLTVGLDSSLEIDAIGQILVGTTYSWPAISAVLDVIDNTKSTHSGFTPTVIKTFDAYGDVKVTATVGLPVSIGFGINVLSGKWVETVSLNNNPSIELDAELFVSVGSGTPSNPTGCNGVAWDINISDAMDVVVTNLVDYPLFTYNVPPISGCIGRKVAVAAPSSVAALPPAATTTSLPPAAATSISPSQAAASSVFNDITPSLLPSSTVGGPYASSSSGLFSTVIGISPLPSPTSGLFSTVIGIAPIPSSTTTATSSPSVSYCPVPTASPPSLGCYYASIFTSPFDPNGELVTTSLASAIVSVESCTSYCRTLSSTFQVIGMAPGYCFCHSSSTLNTLDKEADSSCGYSCPNNPYEICGGAGDQKTFEYITVYSIPPSSPACVQPTPPSSLSSPSPIICFNNYDNGILYTAANGNVFQIHCHTAFPNDDITSYVVSSLDACVSSCSSLAGCVVAEFRTSDGMCFFKSVRTYLPNAVTDLSTGNETHSVLLVSAPSCDLMSCQQNDGNFCSSNGNVFEIACYSSYSATYFSSYNTSSFGACLDICTSTYSGSCHGVNYVASGWQANPAYNCLPFALPINPDLPGNTLLGAVSAIDIPMLNLGYGPHPLALANTPNSLSYPAPITCSNWASDGANYTSPNGFSYKISCHTDIVGSNLGATVQPTFEDCISLCSTMPNCGTVAWVPSQTLNCYPKALRAPPALRPDTVVSLPESDSAIMISGPSCHTMTCPQDNDQFCSSASGELFQISCNTVYGTSYYSDEIASSLAACIDICVAKEGALCKAVEWYVPEYQGANTCLLVSTLDNPIPSGDLYGGVSAISLAGIEQGYGPLNSKREIGNPVAPRYVSQPAAVSSTTVSSSSTSSSSSSSSSSSTVSSTSSSSSSSSAQSTTTSSSTSSTSLQSSSAPAPQQSNSSTSSVTTTTSTSTSSTTAPSAAATSSVPSSDGLNLTMGSVYDTTNTLLLNAGTDGNLFISVLNSTNTTDPLAVNTFSFMNGSMIGDTSARLLHYFPATMSAVGVSRIRVAEWGNIPLTATLISLVPFPSGVGDQEVLVGLDTLGNYFWLFACVIEGVGNKVFLAQDSVYGVDVLQDPDLKFTVTGGVVNDCVPLALVEGEMTVED